MATNCPNREEPEYSSGVTPPRLLSSLFTKAFPLCECVCSVTGGGGGGGKHGGDGGGNVVVLVDDRVGEGPYSV